MSDSRPDRAPEASGDEAKLRDPAEATVLVVDDEPDVVTYLSSVLEDAGIKVLTAHDGDAALEIIKTESVDLISLDLVMPRKSGIRLLVELRKNKTLARIPVIFVTGHAHDPGVRRDVTQALSGSTMAGPAMYLEKPVTPASYLAHICRILKLDCPGEEGAQDRADELRRKALELLEKADPATLEAAIEKLKGGSS
jgi:CheY-like chemotaxis protein